MDDGILQTESQSRTQLWKSGIVAGWVVAN